MLFGGARDGSCSRKRGKGLFNHARKKKACNVGFEGLKENLTLVQPLARKEIPGGTFRPKSIIY